jgi:hypothetical protein
MPTVKLRYTPINGSLTETTLKYLSARGGGEPDAFEIFPGIQHRYLSGAREEQIKGLVRRLRLDLGVIASHNDRIAVLNFLLDANREIVPTIATPAIGFIGLLSGGSLPIGTTQYYKITAVDAIGETVGSNQASATPTSGNQRILLDWSPVAGAALYKIYRSTTTGVPGSMQFLAYHTGNPGYTDDGTVALKPGAVPSSAAIAVALADPSGFANEWLDNIDLGRQYVLDLVERTLRTYHV